MVATPGPKKASAPTTPAVSVVLPDATPTPPFSRERILVYGREGTGKSDGWLKVAEKYPDVEMYVIDTDDSVQRLLEVDYPELKNVNVRVAQTWEDFAAAVDDFTKLIAAATSAVPPTRREECPWLVVDFSDATWDFVQNYFTEQVFDKGIDEFFLQARKTNRGKQLQPLEGWTDWQVINKIFQGAWNKITKGGGMYHLYITAGATDVTGMENKSLYKALKKMPRGEKRMGARVHTVLMASVDSNGWYLSSAKDRGRELMYEKPNVNFAISYLVKIAGWELV